MASTIDLLINTNGVTVLNQTANAAEKTAKGFTSAKAELRALNNQLLTMDQTSDAFKKASARAAELKDNISDLGAEINANAGNAFEGLSNNVGLFGSRLMSLDLKGAGQALSGMGAAVGKIDFKTLKQEVGGLAKGFGDLAKAIIGNPILLLAGVIALVVANFDDLIKLFPSLENALSGINEHQREIAKNAQSTADASKKTYENSSLQENSLRLQGKSEKEILQIKMKKLETSIQDAKVNLEIQEAQAQSQIDASKRNGELLQLIIKGALTNATLGLRLLAAPIDLVLAAANKVSEALGFGAVIAFNINDEISKLLDKGSELGAGLFFDPAAQEKELKESFDNQRQGIDQMTSDYQAAQLSIQKMDADAAKEKAAAEKKANDDLETLQKEADDKELERRKKLNDDMMAEDDHMASIDLNDLIEREKKKTDAKLLGEMQYHANLTALRADQSQKELDADKKLEEDKRKLALDTANAKLEIAQQGLTALTALGDAYFSTQLANVQKGSKAELDLKKKQFAFNKKMQIGGAIMDTAKAITAAIAANPFPSPTLPVSIALASITGAAQIAKIASTKFDGGGGGGGGVNIPTTGADGTTAPSPANFAFLQNQPNQQPPLQAYVVGTQVSSNLEAQQLIQNQSRLGG